ncbi:hypothetical protein OIU77_025674 [Salix suchowensis]|uniref:Uncharacterized protein n=1 Tax=Salix suchowensis TaxID=1278906 RepID=A0ABQ9BX15_9ROSI|nr:hypothetical protein OIU78_012390 [Salix suchowensis]KAJ6391752.1 hypothetical protein OIU77_025674 [Salix suchowensis]
MLGPGTRFPDNQVHSRDSCSYHGVLSYGVLTRKTAEKYCNHHGWDNTGMFGAQRKDVQDEASGVRSPPLWRTSPPRSPQRRRNHYRSLSPSSKAQAIARGQKELSEMVSRMPEGCYELSLRDLVEQPMVFDDVKEESFGKDRNINNQDERILRRGKEKKKNVEKKSQMNRSGSLNNEGFLLKMVSPISFGLRKKKKNTNSTQIINNSSKDGKVSPRPFLFDNGPEKSVDEEWWKNKFSQSKVSENGAGLTNSNSIGSSKRSSSSKSSSRNGSGGCWSFIFAKKGKAAD